MPVPGIISPTLSEVLDYKLERSALFRKEAFVISDTEIA